eukprot:12119972-Alexandrium_andersonii.AAC.1
MGDPSRPRPRGFRDWCALTARPGGRLCPPALPIPFSASRLTRLTSYPTGRWPSHAHKSYAAPPPNS